MARRRKKTTTRRVYRAAPKRRRKSSGAGKVKLLNTPAIVYGAARGTMATFLAPVTSKLGFLGSVSDEVGMGIANYLIAKNTSGMIKKAAIAGLTIENAMLGQEIAKGGLSLAGIGAGSTSNNDVLYG